MLLVLLQPVQTRLVVANGKEQQQEERKGQGEKTRGGEQGAPSVHEQAMEQVREYLAQQDQGGAGAAAPANAVAETEEI